MKKFNRELQVRWSDLDANFHLRHSVYYDWGAFCRIEYLNELGFTSPVMQQHHLGPIIFREECIFRREIRLEDKVNIDMKLVKAKRDFSRWTVRHEIVKNNDVLSAILTVDIAWIDTQKRKLTGLPADIIQTLSGMPVSEDFQWLD